VPLLFAAVAAASAISSVVTIDEQHRRRMAEIEAAKDPYAHYEQKEYLLSPYDNLFRTIGAEYGIDWRLLSAMASAESRFDRNAVSPSGAVGLMQVMPFIGSAYGYEREELFNPEINTRVAAELVRSVYRMLSLPRNIENEERLSFMLACYNAGYSRIDDARNLAEYYGSDALRWAVVKEYLPLLADPEFYEHEVVEGGRFTGSAETTNYVRKVMHRYAQYCRRAEI
jgi:membrane-bound lytic murein transglycosylase F